MKFMTLFSLTCMLFFGAFQLNAQEIADYNVMIVGNETTEDLVEAELITLGHTVTIVPETSVTPDYDYSPYDVVVFLWNQLDTYIDLENLLEENEACQIGIVCMSHYNMQNALGLGVANDWTGDPFEVVDNTHWITEPWPTGLLDLSFTYKVNMSSVLPGSTALGVCGAASSLVVHDTYRRVSSPYYAHTSGMPWSADAGELFDRIICWAAAECCTESTFAFSDAACFSYTSPSGDYEWTTSGVYNDTLINAGGCDSVLTITLEIDTVVTEVTMADNIITADFPGASYQWIDCHDSTIIAGATSQSYEPTENGSYAVIVTTAEGCTDTSECSTIFDLGIEQSLQAFRVYPNPTDGELKIELFESYQEVRFELYNAIGERVLDATVQHGQSMTVSLSDLKSGLYIYRLSADGKMSSGRIVRN